MRLAEYLIMLRMIEEQQVWDFKDMFRKLTQKFPDQKTETIRSIIRQVRS